MLLTISPALAAFLVFLVVAVIGSLVGYIVAKTVTLVGKFGAAMIGLLVALVLGILIWLLVVSSVTFSPVSTAPARYLAGSDPALAGPASAQVSGSCAASPVNPTDGEFVALTSGNYVIEEFDNSLPIPVHKFWAYDVSRQGSITVMATATSGTRAWACTSASAAYDVATQSALGYKGEHFSHEVYGPDGSEVR